MNLTRTQQKEIIISKLNKVYNWQENSFDNFQIVEKIIIKKFNKLSFFVWLSYCYCLTLVTSSLLYFQRKCYLNRCIVCFLEKHSSRRGHRMGKKIARVMKFNKNRKVNDIRLWKFIYIYVYISSVKNVESLYNNCDLFFSSATTTERQKREIWYRDQEAY